MKPEEIRMASRMGKLLKKDKDNEKEIEAILKNPEFSDIKAVGKEKQFLYSSNEMSESYMEMLLSLEEKNLSKSIAELVRKESKLYPRPTPISLFKEVPFKTSIEELQEILSLMQKNDEYRDIKSVSASNSAKYLFSELYMTAAHAKALAEWVEVEQFDNP